MLKQYVMQNIKMKITLSTVSSKNVSISNVLSNPNPCLTFHIIQAHIYIPILKPNKNKI